MAKFLELPGGDMFASEARGLVNPINCVGTMGAGLAKEFKRRYPANWQGYRRAYLAGTLRIGHVLPIVAREQKRGEWCKPQFIYNFPTKYHWRDPSFLPDIAAGLVDLASLVDHDAIATLAVPALGCGLGGLSWLDVQPLICGALEPIESLSVYLYPPR